METQTQTQTHTKHTQTHESTQSTLTHTHTHLPKRSPGRLIQKALIAAVGQLSKVGLVQQATARRGRSFLELAIQSLEDKKKEEDGGGQAREKW